MSLQPRGIRNNNPGNIRWGADWRGLVPQADRTDKSFCQFRDPKWGIRAIARILLNYRSKPGMTGVGGNGIDTVREIISRWAPTNENDTEAYIKSVATACGVKDNDHLNLADHTLMLKLVKAIIKHENGIQPYTDDVLLSGIELA